MLENTSTRNTILGIALLIIIIIWLVFITNNKKGVNLEMEDKIEETIGDKEIMSFMRNDLTDLEKEEIEILLKQRQDREIMIKDILDEAYENKEMEEAWIEVAEMRAKCRDRFLNYVQEDKIEDFKMHCYNDASDFDAHYINK